ncbi:MAG: hypothetical protein GC146_10765 [Limimaricola sp.]|uniref:hypothetical protein n=1 Tax=Limimaricola sp. TaxID=2211665 RepID=UPI001DADAECA|nr:hypothetical protein [Limimaricola sp.]MBI1417692.1 hypothetical protein [Limimaricola sp.]
MKAPVLLIGLIVPLLAGCMQAAGRGAAPPAVVAEEATKAAARSVVAPLVAAQVPETEADALTNCILDNVTPSELTSIAAAASAPSVDPATANLISGVLARPETISCATVALTK